MANNSATLLRNDTAANWTTENPVLLQGEVGVETDTRRMKVGDGTTAWNSLLYVGAGSTFKYGRFTLSADQTTNLANTNPVKFDTVQGSLTVSNYNVALTAGKTYKISFGLSCKFSNASGNVYFYVYDINTSSVIGDYLHIYPTGLNDLCPTQEVIYSPLSNTNIQLRINDPVNLTIIYANYGTRMLVEEYGGV
jgi:hypothetical protein